MSKVTENKEKKGFKEECPRCGNCRFFTCDIETITKWGGNYAKERNLRCAIGTFKVNKMNWCKEHQYKA